MSESAFPEQQPASSQKPETPETEDLVNDVLADTLPEDQNSEPASTADDNESASTQPDPVDSIEVEEEITDSPVVSSEQPAPDSAIEAAAEDTPEPYDYRSPAMPDVTPAGFSADSDSEPANAAILAAPTIRFRVPAIVSGLLLIALGVIFIWPALSGGFILVPGVIMVIAALGITIALLTYWLFSGRNARGALFLALCILFGSVLTGTFVTEPDSANLITNWPAYILALGGALLLTHLGDKHRDRRLLLAGFILLAAGLVALSITTQQLPPALLEIAQTGWPIILIVLVLGLAPQIIRHVPRNE